MRCSCRQSRPWDLCRCTCDTIIRTRHISPAYSKGLPDRSVTRRIRGASAAASCTISTRPIRLISWLAVRRGRHKDFLRFSYWFYFFRTTLGHFPRNGPLGPRDCPGHGRTLWIEGSSLCFPGSTWCSSRYRSPVHRYDPYWVIFRDCRAWYPERVVSRDGCLGGGGVGGGGRWTSRHSPFELVNSYSYSLVACII